MASISALLKPVHALAERDFFNHNKVTVHTPLCTNFEVVRIKRGAYVAYNRVEFMAGCKAYNSLREMKKDLQHR